jgi:hypothetical protein
MADRHKVLVIDNDPGIRRYIRRIPGPCGCEATAYRADCIVLGLDAVPDPGKTLAQLTQSGPRAPLLCLVAIATRGRFWLPLTRERMTVSPSRSPAMIWSFFVCGGSFSASRESLVDRCS